MSKEDKLKLCQNSVKCSPSVSLGHKINAKGLTGNESKFYITRCS